MTLISTYEITWEKLHFTKVIFFPIEYLNSLAAEIGKTEEARTLIDAGAKTTIKGKNVLHWYDQIITDVLP